MAIICHYSSLCNEYIHIRSIKQFFTFPISLPTGPTRPHKSLISKDTKPANYREYYNLLLARAQMIGRLLLESRTKQALEYEKKNRQYTNEEMFQDDQMIYLLAPHSSALQADTIKLKQDFIGPLFVDTAIDKTHYRLKDATGLPLDGTYHVNRIKKGSTHTPQGIVDTFDGYQKALKNT